MIKIGNSFFIPTVENIPNNLMNETVFYNHTFCIHIGKH